jgi:hypothetical protein
LLVHALNDDFPILIATTDLQAIAYLHVLGGFGRCAVQFDLAAIYGIGSKTAGLEEAGGP